MQLWFCGVTQNLKFFHHEPELIGSSNICQVWLLWGDVIYLLCCCHRKNFAVLLWFCDNCFQWEKLIVYKSNLVIFRYDLATQLIFYNKFSWHGNIARSYILRTLTSNEPVIGRWKRTQNDICLWVRRYGISADVFVQNWASFQSNLPWGVTEDAQVFFSWEGQQRSGPACTFGLVVA